MNYNSWIFWGLFALVLLPYWRLAHRHQNTLLLVASYLFYGFWDYRFVFLILLSTTIDYVSGLAIGGVAQTRRQGAAFAGLLLATSMLLCTNLDYSVFTLPRFQWFNCLTVAMSPRQLCSCASLATPRRKGRVLVSDLTSECLTCSVRILISNLHP